MASYRLHVTIPVALFFATQAWAQSQPTESGPEEPAATIVVTGSRIAKPDYETSNPIVSVDAATIEGSGRTNLTDFLSQLPSLVGSQTSNDSAGSATTNFIGATGLNLLDLRNL